MAKGRILIMDDDESVTKVVSQMLNIMGYDVAITKDGVETIKLYKFAMELGFPYDVVILDIIIPGGMGGEKTIKRLIEMDPEVKAIVSSGYSDNPIMADYRKYGFKAVIPKPFELQELAGVVKMLIKGAVD